MTGATGVGDTGVGETGATGAEGATGADALHLDYIGGLGLANDTDTEHDILIYTGECRDSTDVDDLVLSSVLTKQIDASWAVGDDQGGLDGTESSAGTPDASTCYYVWLIKRSDTGVVDALYSESATAPIMPANYYRKRLIGFVVTNASANIEQFIHSGSLFRFTTPFQVVYDNTLTSGVDETLTMQAPPSCIAHLYASSYNGTYGSGHTVRVKTFNGADNDWKTAVNHAHTADGISELATKCDILLDSSSRLKYAVTFSAGTPRFYLYFCSLTMLTRDAP